MTKYQILTETACFYDLKNRGIEVLPSGVECSRYLIPEGSTRNAIGHFMMEDIDTIHYNDGFSESIYSAISDYDDVYDIDDLDSYLKEEYRGHSLEFWNDLNKFHNDSDNWSDDGLSLRGLNEWNKLKIKYKEN